MSTQEANDKAEARREACRRYYAANKEKGKARAKAWRANNPERAKETSAAYKKANGRALYEKTKERRNKWHYQYQKEKAAADPQFKQYRRILVLTSRAMGKHRSGRQVTQASEIVRLLGCPWLSFIKHIEAKFQPGMSWANHGHSGWHFDHIRPLSSFDLTNDAQLLIACHFTNVQPMWAADNVRKGGKTE